MASKIMKFGSSKSIFYVKERLNLFKRFFHWKYQFRTTIFCKIHFFYNFNFESILLLKWRPIGTECPGRWSFARVWTYSHLRTGVYLKPLHKLRTNSFFTRIHDGDDFSRQAHGCFLSIPCAAHPSYNTSLLLKKFVKKNSGNFYRIEQTGRAAV